MKAQGRNEDMISSTVKDIFSKGFVSVREDDTLSSCLSLFKEEMPPVLVVLDSEGRYKGVIARRCARMLKRYACASDWSTHA